MGFQAILELRGVKPERGQRKLVWGKFCGPMETLRTAGGPRDALDPERDGGASLSRVPVLCPPCLFPRRLPQPSSTCV